MSLFLIKNNAVIDARIYTPETTAIFSIVKPLSIKIPNKAVPNAVAKTIKAVVKAFIEPICLTPYISAHVEDPKTFARPLEIPINPRKKNEEIGFLK